MTRQNTVQQETAFVAAAIALLCSLSVARASETIAPLAVIRGCPLVQVSVDGSAPAPFLLELGLAAPLLDDAFARQLGLAPADSSAAKAWTAEVTGLGVGDLAPYDGAAGVLDLTPLHQRLGAYVAGLFPARQAGYELTLELGRNTAVWRPIEEARLSAADAHAVPLSLNAAGAPTLETVLNETFPVRVSLDLLMPETLLLDRATAQKAGGGLGTAELLINTPDAKQRSVARAQSLVVDRARMEEPFIIIREDAAGARLGMGFLKNCRITLNFEYGLAAIEMPGGGTCRETMCDGFGFTLESYENGFWRLGVAKGSPASEAGICAGDALIAVEGLSASGAAADALDAYLRATEGAARVFTIDRAGQSVDVKLTARRLL